MGRWNDSLLDAMREVGDPPADDLMRNALAEHGLERLHRIMRSLVENDDIVPADIPVEIRDYLEQTAVLPDWAEPRLIKHGQRFFNLHWPNIVMLLFCASLPSAYSAAKGAQVLFLTGRLTGDVHRRIFETAQFVLNVMAPKGLEPSGRGIRTVQKVRLMHATIRQYLEIDPRWKKEWEMEWGLPINQEDMAGTLMTFSSVPLTGIQHFGIRVTPAQQEAYIHAWKVVGHILGVREELLPTDADDANDLFETIIQRQAKRSDAGIQLANHLVEFMQQQMWFPALSGFPATIIRHCIDKRLADLLEIERSDWTLLLLVLEETALGLVSRFTRDHRKASRLLSRYSHCLVQRLVKLERGGKRTRFRIPDTLRSPV